MAEQVPGAFCALLHTYVHEKTAPQEQGMLVTVSQDSAGTQELFNICLLNACILMTTLRR